MGELTHTFWCVQLCALNKAQFSSLHSDDKNWTILDAMHWHWDSEIQAVHKMPD